MNAPLFFANHLVTGKRILPLLALFATMLLFLPGQGMHNASAAQPAAAAPGRTIYVAPQAKGDGSKQNTALPDISRALAESKPGDTIIIAPGVYRERLRVNKRNLRIMGSYSADNTPQVTVVAPNAASEQLLVDTQNTLWSGIAFQANNGATADLRAFEGRFEHCLFDLRGYLTALDISAGSPSFHACTFINQSGPGAAVVLGKDNSSGSSAQFSYCLFRDIEGGAFLFRGAQNIRIINCVFANIGYIGMRSRRCSAYVSVANSVFYLTTAQKLFLQEPFDKRVPVENSIFAPAPSNHMVWNCLDLSRQPEIINIGSRTLSPRFEGGRHTLLNLCIDDTRNYALWLSIVPYAKKLGLNITLSLNVEALTPEIWKSIIPANNDGFELASHGATHTSLIARDALRLGGDILVSQSTTVDIDADENFTIWTDGKPAYARELGAEPNITLGELTKDLEEKGFRAQLVDLSYRNLPARLLQDVKGQDIYFSNYEPIFILDTKKYQHWTLRESRKAIEEGLKQYNARQKIISVIVAPYAENGPGVMSAMDDTGYTLARSKFDDIDYVSPLKEVNLYFMRSSSLGKVFATMPIDNRKEMFRVYLDYMKYHGAIMGVYAHGTEEVSPKDWTDIFDVISGEPLVETLPLAEIARIVQTQCTQTGKGTYRCDSDKGPLSGKISFRPRIDSPLLAAGVPTGCTTNFVGEMLSNELSPNIGIY